MRVFGISFGRTKPAAAPVIEASSSRSSASRRTRVAAFRAAEQDNVNYSWTKTPVPINTMIEKHLAILRARSRDVGVNTDHGAAFLRLCRDNIVGAEGMQLRVMGRFRSGGGDLDEDANKAAYDAWSEWGVAEYCTMGRELAMPDLQRAAITTVAEDGEAFFRIVTGSRAGREWPIALHQIDAELCPLYNRNLPGGRRVRLGIERDDWGRPLAYWFYKADPNLKYQALPTLSTLERIPADEIVHLYVPERPGQARGVPWMVPSLQRVKMLGAYDEAALVAARIGANKVGVLQTPTGEGPIMTDDEDAAEEQKRSGYMVVDSPGPGEWVRLADGEQIQPWSPDYPRGEYSDFTAACLRGISAGLGVGYQSLSMDRKGASYSSGRLETQQERETWKALQGVFSRKFCRRVYLRWLPIALMAEKIVVNETPLPLEREGKLRRHRWQGRRWEWVDPDGDMSSKISAVDLGITTVSEIIRETGRDPREVFEERRQELREYDDILAKQESASRLRGSLERSIAKLQRSVDDNAKDQ